MEQNQTFTHCADELQMAYIRNHMSKKTQENPAYSLRAMARDLRIDASYLSQIIRLKKKITPQAAYKMAVHFKLEGIEQLNFLTPSLRD